MTKSYTNRGESQPGILRQRGKRTRQTQDWLWLISRRR